MIVHGLIVLLFLTALGFNIWGKTKRRKNVASMKFSGYILCESSSQISQEKSFVPGVCRGESQAWSVMFFFEQNLQSL